MVKKAPRETYQDLLDVYFSSVGQCSEQDCAEQEAYFDIRDYEDFQSAWSHKFLLDMDGNAFSGRFYAFLQSQSLTFKLALFREWHEEWLFPWVHYIPLSLNGSEHVEMMRYLTQDEEGRRIGEDMAKASSEWARKVTRYVDLEAWMFRLLLEYGRLVDDDRENIGFRLS